MVLIDTGPLVALVDKADKTHKKAASIFRSFKTPPLTTWACLTEAFYVIGEGCGWRGQKTLLELLTRGAIRIHSQNDTEVHRISELMEQYHDNPMDFADASLVTLAELRGVKKIFTLDSDFYVFRISGKDSFEVILLSA
jgi:uncharacterized protein